MTKSNWKSLFLPFFAASAAFLILGCVTTPQKPEDPPSSAPPVETPAAPVEEPLSLAEQLASLRSVEDLDKALEVMEDAEGLTLRERIVLASLEIAEGKLDDAEKTLEGVLAEEPGNPDALYTSALLYDARGRDSTRDARLGETLAADPDHVDALLFQGMVRIGRREYAPAGENFLRVLASQPENFLALSGAATAQMYQDNLEEAVGLLDRAIALEPEYAYLYSDRGKAWRGLKKYGKAEENYSRAIELEPDVEWHYLDRARIRLQYFHDLESAWEDLTRLQEINKDNFFGNVYMAGILDDWKRYDEAEKFYRKVLAARPNYGFAHAPLAKIAYMNGRYADAKEHFLRAYDFESRDHTLLLAAAVCMEKNDDRRGAEKLLKQMAPRVPRGTLEYEMFRYFLSPGSDFFISDRIKKEENEELKSRMYFYLGARYDLSGLRQSALAAYGKVNEKSEFFESDLAAWELGRTEG